MNLDPSDLPRLAGAASLSKPGFDIILAVSGARQAMLPTAGLLQTLDVHEARHDPASQRRAMLCGTIAGDAAFGPRPTRFFDLSEEVTGLSETMNSLFTRGFQPMLNSSTVDILPSDAPLSDGEKVE
ncbi:MULTISPECIES: hypothetical protein [unclassified Sphingopyxis]|jgi:hypothetical protein|uniref:hypothetical protein n=1 Tax=unclassified Sphingopyxis TaxID=2614943 RepID=UPI00073759B9|nr:MULTISPECIES: hypothetical protein [unclassified Sphingopyxis]KTE24249.1 hypothetical protein ATE62_22520 [Sphingopyxis sp. HIX]KTE84465.1 hypothetical protein ATE72_08345 [Sphingopyxis sp. HXXIV]